MPMLIPDDVRAKAEIYTGDAAGQEKTRLLLAETELPLGLLPLKDIIECGYVEETGFVWLKQKKKVDHYFAKAGRYVSYAAEVSAIAEKGRLRKITGVKAKEMLIWVSLHEICVDDPPTGKIHCKALGGLSRSFPVEAFEPDVPFPKPVTSRLKKKTETETESTNVKAVDEKKEEEQKEAAAAEEAAPEKEKEKEATVVAAAVDEVCQKMKKVNKQAAVQPEVVAANN